MALVAILVAGLAGYATVTNAWTHGDTQYSAADQVTRLNAPMIVLPKPVPTPTLEPISQQLVQPVRLIDKSSRPHDLSVLVTDALHGFGYAAAPNDRLLSLLVKTLAERQSDAYIDAVLNAALSRNEIAPPPVLIDRNGQLETDVLLNAVLNEVSS